MSTPVSNSDCTKDLIPTFSMEFYKICIWESLSSAFSSFSAYQRSIDLDDPAASVSRYLQNALSQSAEVSRYFWNTTSELARFRSEKLRAIYEIDESSPLNNRNLRNHLEHFDEKLDKWIKRNPIGPVIVTPIFLEKDDLNHEFGHVFKGIVSENDVLISLGKAFEFGPICAEICRLIEKFEFIESNSL